jgi:hypothetical protein
MSCETCEDRGWIIDYNLDRPASWRKWIEAMGQQNRLGERIGRIVECPARCKATRQSPRIAA